MRASNYLPVNGDFFTKINGEQWVDSEWMNKIHQIHSLHFSRQEVKKFFWLLNKNLLLCCMIVWCSRCQNAVRGKESLDLWSYHILICLSFEMYVLLKLKLWPLKNSHEVDLLCEEADKSPIFCCFDIFSRGSFFHVKIENHNFIFFFIIPWKQIFDKNTGNPITNRFQ